VQILVRKCTWFLLCWCYGLVVVMSAGVSAIFHMTSHSSNDHEYFTVHVAGALKSILTEALTIFSFLAAGL
jgi:hypothetical protein